MNIAIIDADLIGRGNQRFPNLVSEKLSGYYKSKGNNVILKLDYNNLEDFDKVFISKVFTDTSIDERILSLSNVEYGGTGFFFDRAPSLPLDIEHILPDYNLYNDFIKKEIENGKNESSFKEYLDYSVGFLTRGCFRKCGFCVNQKYNKVFKNSYLEEFHDSTRKKFCFLDDNFLGYHNWKNELKQIINIGKPFKFKQGLDERLLTEEKCDLLFNSFYDGDITFAFDSIKDYDLIKSKLELIKKYITKQVKFYILCGFESIDLDDIINTFERIKLLMQYGCIPYIMRYQSANNKPWESSKYRGIYILLSRWCNQIWFFKTKSLKEFCEVDGGQSTLKYLNDFKKENPNLFEKYFNLKYSDFN